jgi:hypothetical protein
MRLVWDRGLGFLERFRGVGLEPGGWTLNDYKDRTFYRLKRKGIFIIPLLPLREVSKNKNKNRQRQVQRQHSIAAPCGLRSGLRQSGRPLRGWL